MGQKHGEWLRGPCQNYRPFWIDACVESLASTGLPLSATLTCGKPQGKRLWGKSWQAETGHGSDTHSGDQITALPDKLFSGTRREVDGEGDRATAGGETQTTPSSREVFPGSSWNACPGTGGTGGTLSVAYVPRWNDSRLQIRADQIKFLQRLHKPSLRRFLNQPIRSQAEKIQKLHILLPVKMPLNTARKTFVILTLPCTFRGVSRASDVARPV